MTTGETTEQAQDTREHGGKLIARRLKSAGVSKLFTLSGGHIFSVYDGCRDLGIDIVDVRHEQTAAFAAEGWAKVTREPGVCALTAGPGVTNGMSAITGAYENETPMVVLGGRAPAFRWGQGSLQEIDHVPFMRPVTRMAATAQSPDEIPDLIDQAFDAATGQPGGPAFVDLPLDLVFSEGVVSDKPFAERDPKLLAPADGALIERAGALLAGAERPVIMAGTGLYWGHGENALRELSEQLQIPVFLNGQGRGCLPADHPNYFSRARSAALNGADVALVIGCPLDFRLGFGGSFGEDTELIVIAGSEPDTRTERKVAVELYGGVARTLVDLGSAASGGAENQRSGWIGELRAIETEKRAGEQAELDDSRSPLHPLRVYKELAPMLDRDATIVCDGGDFVSYAGKMIETYEPGCWMDPGPYGCLGTGPGYALAATLAKPGKQVVMMMGDGAFGFAGMDFDTFVRHDIPVVAVIGNNGIWGLEKHPMEFLYGYSVAADLIPGTRYDKVVEALGGHGELVDTPEQLRPALERAFESGKPSVVNVLTDPTVMYPRSANLA
ncbi:MAG TPA: acetolactate synthase [Solirubrobacterales bacterium]|nr:acetolactate synthase [Solirubrobacterales bacterium]